MSDFRYDAYRSPYAESIAESIAAPGRVQAQGVLNAGHAHAAGQQQRAQVWGQAIQTLGQLPQQIQQYAAQAQEIEMRSLQLATLKRQQASQQVLSIAIKKFTDPQTGKRDDQSIANFVSQQGYPEQGEAWLKMAVGNAENLDKLAELGRGHQRHQLETLGDLAYMSNSPAEFTAAVGLAAASGLIVNAQGQVDEAQAHEIAAQAATPDGWKKIKAQYEVFSPKYQAAQAKLKEPVKVGEGEILNTPERAAAGLPPLMTGGPKTVTSAQLDARAQVLYAKQTAGTLTAAEAAELDAYEKRTGGNDPITVKTMVNGQPVERVMRRSDALQQGLFASQPPAAIIVNNAAEQQDRTLAPVDATRPSGLDANKVDPITGKTPNAIFQDALSLIMTGVVPNQGFGQALQVRAARNAIENKAAAILSAAGVDLPTVRAQFKEHQAVLTRLGPIFAATAVASNTANDSLQLALNASADVPRTDAKLVNRYGQWAQGQLTEAAGLSQFELYIYTASREYAKVVSGSSASTQGLTDTATAHAQQLLNAAQAPGAFKAVVTGMQRDMQVQVTRQREGLARESGVIANLLSAAWGVQPSGQTVAPPAAPPSGGRFRRDANGNIVPDTGPR